jgi:hypothetical protein
MAAGLGDKRSEKLTQRRHFVVDETASAMSIKRGGQLGPNPLVRRRWPFLRLPLAYKCLSVTRTP